MIPTQQKEAQVLVAGDADNSMRMELDLESADMLMMMLSKNLYADGIGSTIRELASNALDSHRRAGVNKPIVITLKPNKDSNYEFSVEDFGVGLDDDDVRDIIRKYGKSLAREEANALGLMGLGFKSPLAYTSSFYFIARKDGIERKYMMYEGEEGNAIDSLDCTLCSKPNGVKVIVPVREKDAQEFAEKIREQLAYFESVYFDVPAKPYSYYNSYYDAINNGFKILRENDFQMSELVKDSSMHLCLDNVYYPIDWGKLGIKRIEVPVGLRFGLSDGIFPVPSREAIRYTQEAKAAILNKIKRVAEWFVERYNKEVKNTDDIHEIFSYYENSNRSVHDVGGKTIRINELIPYSPVTVLIPKLKGVELLNLKNVYENKYWLLNEYRVKYRFRNGKLKTCKYDGETPSIDRSNYYSPDITYIFSDVIGGVKKEYLRMLWSGKKVDLVKRIKEYKLGRFVSKYSAEDNYIKIIGLRSYPKSEWRQRIKEYQYVQSLFLKNWIDLDSLQIPQTWLDARKRQRVGVMGISGDKPKKQRIQGEIPGKMACDLKRYMDGRNCKFVPDSFKLEEMHKKPYFLVYTDHDSYMKLDALYPLKHTCGIRFATFSPREIKNLERIRVHNLMTYETFMEGKNKVFKRVVTAYLIRELISENYDVFSRKELLKPLSASLVEKLTKLTAYKSNNYVDVETNKAMVELAEEYNLFDTTIYDTYLEVKEILSRFPWLQTLMDRMKSYSPEPEIIDVIRDMFKYHKFRLDPDNYNPPASSVPTEEPEEENENEENE